jgi:hypothetical protein
MDSEEKRRVREERNRRKRRKNPEEMVSTCEILMETNTLTKI